MGLSGGKRGATMAPSVEKPTAITASSAHSSKIGTVGPAHTERRQRRWIAAVLGPERLKVYP
jgi:hypothetical protein